jgi:hypothetical protein
MARVAAIALCSVVGLASTAARGPVVPAAPQAPPRAAGVIIGQVVNGSSTNGIAEAVVTLTRAAAGAASGARAVGPGAVEPLRRVITGSDGRFVFHSLLPATYQVSASRAGYSAQPRVNFVPTLGAAMVSAVPAQQLVTLAEREIALDVRLRLLQDAVIAGTVLDEKGEPAAGVSVQAARRVMMAGRVRFLPISSSQRTDDRGRYRISGLPQGDYLVLVPQTQITMPAGVVDGLLRAMASGDNGPMMEIVSSGVSADALIEAGLRVGPVIVSSKSGTVPISGDDGQLLAYPTTYYPGTSAPGQASVVSLSAGEVRGGVDFALRLIRTLRISGTALWPDGRPYPHLTLRLVAAADPSAPDVEIDVANAVTDPRGRFDFLALPPGQFIVRAAVQPRPAAAGAGAPPSAELNAPPVVLFAHESVALGGEDVDNLILHLVEGSRITGNVQFESATGRKPPGPGALALSLTPVDGRYSGLVLSFPDRPTNTDGQFATRGYPPGRYRIGVTASGWMLKAATLAGADVLDAPLEIRDSPLRDLVLTLTDRLPTITGTVVAADAADRGDTTVVLFPADHRRWVASGMSTRRLYVGPVDQNGSFTLPDVLPGDYLVVAIARSDEGDTLDPAFISRLEPLATRVTVDLATTSQSLRRVRVAR